LQEKLHRVTWPLTTGIFLGLSSLADDDHDASNKNQVIANKSVRAKNIYHLIIIYL
jgi:hypothetical protein